MVSRDIPSDLTACFRAPLTTPESLVPRNYVSTRDVKNVCAYWFRRTNCLKPESNMDRQQRSQYFIEDS